MAADPWILRPHPRRRARLRLFCFPYAGGSASLFAPWADDLPDEIEVFPVQLPGRERRLREPLLTRMDALLAALLPAIHPYLDLPYALFGHSMGAVIAFELARQRALPGPVHLFASARRAPQVPARKSAIHALPDAGFVAELRRFNSIPEAVLQNADLRQIFLPILRADFALYETYAYLAGPPLDCSISAFGGCEDVNVTRADLEGWREQTRAGFVLRMFAGDHFFLRDARPLLLRAIAHDLLLCQNGTGEAFD